MSGMILIHEDDASHAKACAEYLAMLATKYVLARQHDDIDSEGDSEDVANNLAAIVAVLEGKPAV